MSIDSGRLSERAARAVVTPLLRRTRHGTLTLIDGASSECFGASEPGGPAVTITVHAPRFYPALLRGSLGLADA